MEKYIFNKEIGSGSFGKVFLVESKSTGIQYVIKEIDLTKLDKKQTSSACKEVEVLSKLKHNNVVRYKESYEEKKHLFIVMEYCENGDLHQKIKSRKLKNECFSDDEILDYFVQICLALEYIHEQRILHRDLKSKNIFLTKGNVVKLGDFGIAKMLENSFELAQTCIGSPFYISPEICENKPYDKKSDVWALGCILYELSTLKYAFVTRNMKSLLARIIAGNYNSIPTSVNIQIRNLIDSMLKSNPKDRPTVSAILKKPFLQKHRSKYNCDVRRYSVYRKRSKSNEGFRNLPTLNNDSKNLIKGRMLSGSCVRLNELNKNKNEVVSKPEMKYNTPVVVNRMKTKKKPLNIFKGKDEVKEEVKKTETETQTDDNSKKMYIDNMKNIDRVNWAISKIVKLPKVDSQYYNLIAENNRKGKEECNKCFENEQNTIEKNELLFDLTSKFLVNKKNKTEKKKMIDLDDNGEIIEDVKDKRDLLTSEEDLRFVHSDKELNKEKQNNHNDSRKKWSANTLDKGKLIEFLSEADLIGSTVSDASLYEETSKKFTVDEILRVDPSEINSDVLTPVKVNYKDRNSINIRDLNHSDWLKEEIDELRKRYRKNENTYKIEDLIRLTENCRKILILQVCQNYTSDNENVKKENNDSVYFNLELRRMNLEKKIGFYLFIKVYRKMISILNNNIALVDNSEVNGTETYVVSEKCDTGAQALNKAWMDVIDVLGDHQKYLPDIWEVAICESIYYNGNG